MNCEILELINDHHYRQVLTICGSAKFRALKEKYQAYYTIKNNVVYAPVNYLSIKNEVEVSREEEVEIAARLADIHDYKIRQSIAIIVVTDENGYYGSHTAREINYAKERGCKILYTHVAESERDKYYFNNDQTYPLYILKEE